MKTIIVNGSPHDLYYDMMNNLLFVNIENTISIIDGISNKVIANNIIIGFIKSKFGGEYNNQIYVILPILITYPY